MKITDETIAVILGDIDMLRPLALAGIRCAVVAARGDLPRYSRYARHIIEWSDPWRETDKLVETLIEFAEGKKEKPVLIYESDADLMLISRNRRRLGELYRFVVPDAELTEDLVDKLRFQKLSQRLSLPVPRTRVSSNHSELQKKQADLNFPLIAKPLTRKASEWSPIAGLGKAVRIETEEELNRFQLFCDSKGIECLMQELVPGDESEIESYHVYVDRDGLIAGEFTGKKIRTYPTDFGQSCALTISDASDVADLGRELVQRLKFRGLAKFDFKRAPDGELFLLEVNPRFSLWHHLGMKAGINLPLLVYCDLTGIPRPAFTTARAGTNWCRVWQDFYSARSDGIPFSKWIVWALKCEAKPGFSLDDPLPLFAAAFWRKFYRVMPKSFIHSGVRLRATKSGLS